MPLVQMSRAGTWRRRRLWTSQDAARGTDVVIFTPLRPLDMLMLMRFSMGELSVSFAKEILTFLMNIFHLESWLNIFFISNVCFFQFNETSLYYLLYSALILVISIQRDAFSDTHIINKIPIYHDFLLILKFVLDIKNKNKYFLWLHDTIKIICNTATLLVNSW